MSTKTRKSPAETKPCACTRLGTDCGRTTKSTWAVGHDARIKGFLQRAHRAGTKVQLDGRETTALTATRKLAPALVPFLGSTPKADA